MLRIRGLTFTPPVPIISRQLGAVDDRSIRAIERLQQSVVTQALICEQLATITTLDDECHFWWCRSGHCLCHLHGSSNGWKLSQETRSRRCQDFRMIVRCVAVFSLLKTSVLRVYQNYDLARRSEDGVRLWICYQNCQINLQLVHDSLQLFQLLYGDTAINCKRRISQRPKLITPWCKRT